MTSLNIDRFRQIVKLKASSIIPAIRYNFPITIFGYYGCMEMALVAMHIVSICQMRQRDAVITIYFIRRSVLMILHHQQGRLLQV